MSDAAFDIVVTTSPQIICQAAFLDEALIDQHGPSQHVRGRDAVAARYAQMAPRMREICARYGVHYNTGGFWRQYGRVLLRIFKFSVPSWQT